MSVLRALIPKSAYRVLWTCQKTKVPFRLRAPSNAGRLKVAKWLCRSVCSCDSRTSPATHLVSCQRLPSGANLTGAWRASMSTIHGRPRADEGRTTSDRQPFTRAASNARHSLEM